LLVLWEPNARKIFFMMVLLSFSMFSILFDFFTFRSNAFFVFS